MQAIFTLILLATGFVLSAQPAAAKNKMSKPPMSFIGQKKQSKKGQKPLKKRANYSLYGKGEVDRRLLKKGRKHMFSQSLDLR